MLMKKYTYIMKVQNTIRDVKFFVRIKYANDNVIINYIKYIFY